VIPKLIHRFLDAKEKSEPRVLERGAGASTRDFLFVKDAAEAIVMAADSYDAAEPLNIASGKETSIRDLASTIGKLVGYEGTIEFNGSPEKEDRVVADISRAKKWGWSPRTDLEEGLKRTIEWHCRK
jgi:nucleoside-diphosphate-sugar epimerase